MRDFFQSWKFKVIICLFALMIGFLVYAALNAGTVPFPEMVLKTITGPFSKAANSVTIWVEDNIDKLVNANKYKEENIILREQLTEMYAQIKNMNDLEKENEQLREMLDIAKDNKDFAWAPPCSIISRNAADITKGFSIDRGSNDGIEVGDPVVNDVGLVGIVSEVAPTFSEVTTLISTEISIGVMTVSGHIVGLVENTLTYASEQRCLMNYIEKGSDIKIGDIVVTSGGSVFPAGIVVGEIVEIFPDENGLSLHAVIEPIANISNITECFVITGFDGQGVALEP